MAKKPTRLQQEYQQELKRLRKGFKRYEKEGYLFPDEKYGQLPKKVTQKKLESIKQVKPKQLTQISERVDLETGEILSQSPTQSAPQQTQTTAPRQEEDYIPSLTIVDSIRERINELPDVNRSARGGGIPIAGRRNGLLAILEDNVNSRDGEELEEYIDYLIQNQGALLSELTHITYESDEEKIKAEFGHAAEILNGGDVLTPMQSESVSVMQEYY